ncbi:Alpha-aminoadipate--LysW ligase LysX protein [Marine Group I thaumarchaeote SCGC AAA799-E16]|uniref:Alpha-aminoadipate--LysW ligase LysX protein n=4 Tax=Marine Group I TaxID=905826 RepID=A0A081RMX0_9ARCH|nr:Alpha-aminoadipate--LysW ligase LysX protein [Marine Group I thaumarchaeote SCGC AAA799-N04]KER05600.1 Alpha-aminoadipate--LysW ligase LysX protein [Marine Group I thaumarchaeote SCGC AAA799-E16]KFM15595.1 Alpha-aminoadipate--LysW ligase LysX protein [Marine Group I thaumarchaeote SCGC AAA799-D11]KFM16829.1 Alpha-aminoadipate--LysW ligase LysX protein [Marine Group I thaumarchaeote SCGC RSA3]
MSKVCIVFDRLRAEEKMLQKEAAELGHDTVMLDAKITQVNTDSKKEDFDLGDVVLERCVSYFRGLHFTASLEFMDIPVLNKFDVASICGNKMFMTLLLKKAGVPTPKTYFSFTSESAAENLEKVGYPLVIKPVIGSWGRGVMPIKDRDTLDAISEIRDITDSPHDRIYYLQELVERPPRDIRVITVGDEPVAAMYRKSSGGFKTNIALGADPELCEITKEMEDMAAKASKAMGGGILGIDMMEDEKNGLVVHEVNNTVEFKGLARVAQRNIPKEMVEFALNYVRK